MADIQRSTTRVRGFTDAEMDFQRYDLTLLTDRATGYAWFGSEAVPVLATSDAGAARHPRQERP